jgi:myo-inositol-1(or 4)-monophosphatase
VILLTNADIEAEDAMFALLRREPPNDSVLGEETGSSGADSNTRTWLIDPLCGTLNYAVKMRVAAVNAALRVEGKLTVAAVADPFNEEIFWTDGATAFSRINDQDISITPSGKSRLVDLNLDPPFSNAPFFAVAKVAADLEFAAHFRPRVVSTTIALCWVATGQRAAYVPDGDMRGSIHFAAGLAICEQASCNVTDLFGNVWGSGATGLLAAANSDTHTALLRIVMKYLKPGP